MNHCSFYNCANGQCKLLTRLVDPNGFYPTINWCHEICGPDNKAKQKTLLHGMGVFINEVPKGHKELLEYLKTHKINRTEATTTRLKILKKENEKRKNQRVEIAVAVAKLPPLTQRLVSLDNWVKDIAVPFEKQTGLLFTTKPHKLERDATCRQCPFMVKEGKEDTANAVMSCSKCGCRMGKRVADPNEPDPHEIMGKLKAMGAAGKTADAIRIKSASWYAAKRCGNWQEEDRWAEVDAKHLTDEQLKIREELYAGKSGE